MCEEIQVKQIIPKKQSKSNFNRLETETMKDKPLHGKYYVHTEQVHVDKHRAHQWLWSTESKAETEGIIHAAQDQFWLTRN